MLRGDSRHHAKQVGTIVREMRSGGLRPETGKAALQATRRAVELGWRGVADVLDREGQTMLGREVREFVQRMPPPLTEKEWYAGQAHKHAQARMVQRSETKITRARSDKDYARQSWPMS